MNSICTLIPVEVHVQLLQALKGPSIIIYNGTFLGTIIFVV